MDLGYLQRLRTRTAGRIDFAECGRPAGRFEGEREVLERAANALDDLSRWDSIGPGDSEIFAAAAKILMRAGY